MSNCLVSIVIPTKNRVCSTKRAIQSCLDQDYSPIEIVIVDDGSEPENRLDKWVYSLDFQNVRVKFIQLNTSRGGGYARNRGVSDSSGEYVTFLDSDDVLFPDAISFNFSFHQKLDTDSITYGKGVRSVYNNGELIRELGVYPLKEKGESQSVGSYLFCNDGRMFTPTLFMKRVVFDRVKFDTSLPRHQDYGFVLKAESLGIDLKFVDKAIFRWISDENSESSKKKNIDLNVSSIFLDGYSCYLEDNEIKAYLAKVSSPLAIKNLKFIEYVNLNRKHLNKGAYLFSTLSLVQGLFRLIKAKVKVSI